MLQECDLNSNNLTTQYPNEAKTDYLKALRLVSTESHKT